MRTLLSMLIVLTFVACSPKAEKAEPPTAAAETPNVVRSLDTATLASLPDDQVEQAILDYVHATIDGHYDREREFLAGFPAGIRALYVTSGVEAEVNNGGFNQYYWNSTGEFADEAPAAFEFFSASKHAELMRLANQMRAAEKAEIDKFKAKGTLEAFSESYKFSKLDALDERFYKIDEDLSALRVAKIRAEPSLFVGQ